MWSAVKTLVEAAGVASFPLGDSISPTFRVFPGRPTGGPRPGAFHLPAPAVPLAMAAWPGHGWPAATNAFEVELEGGRRGTLPFTVGNP